MTERLKGKRILVTAAAQGIGRSTVEVSLHTKTGDARRERRVCGSERNVNTDSLKERGRERGEREREREREREIERERVREREREDGQTDRETDMG